MTYQLAPGAVSRQNRRRRTPVHTLSLRRFKRESLPREHGEPARKKTETRYKAEAGKKCMSGRRAEERVKSNEDTKGTRGSQRPNKGRAQGSGHGRHTANTTPHRDTGEGSTRGTREERHHAPRHARHRHHTHRTHPTSPGSPPSGRAVGGGTAPDLRRPSQWWKAPPPGTPFRHPHSEQRPPAGAHAVGLVLGPYARTERTRDTRDAEPWLPAPEDGRPGEGQRLTPGAPHNGGKHPPLGTPFRQPHSEQRQPARAYAVGPVLGPHARIDRTRDTRVAEPRLPAPEDGRPGEGQRLTPGAPHNGGRPPPPGTAPHHPRGTQPPQGMQAKGTVLGPHTHTPAPTARGWRTPTARPMGGQLGEGQRLTSDAYHNGGRHPPRGRHSATPPASNASPRGRTPWGRCWVPTPAPTAPGTHGTRDPGCPLQRTGGRGRDSA